MAKLPKKVSMSDIISRTLAARSFLRANYRSLFFTLSAMVVTATNDEGKANDALGRVKLSVKGFPPNRIVATSGGDELSSLEIRYTDDNEVVIGKYFNSN